MRGLPSGDSSQSTELLALEREAAAHREQIDAEDRAKQRAAPVAKLQSMFVNTWITVAHARKLLTKLAEEGRREIGVDAGVAAATSPSPTTAEGGRRGSAAGHGRPGSAGHGRPGSPKGKGGHHAHKHEKPAEPPLPRAIAIPHGPGSDSVRTVMSLFGRLVDLEHIDELLDDREALTAADAQELHMRLGWLNVYDPRKAERAYVLDMSLGEHRGVMELLASMGEPGETWQCEVPGNTNGALFRHPAEKACIPGFTLRALKGKWEMSPDAIPHAGFFRMRYSMEAFDAVKVPAKRQAMVPRVLVGAARFPEPAEVPDPDVFPVAHFSLAMRRSSNLGMRE